MYLYYFFYFEESALHQEFLDFDLKTPEKKSQHFK